MGVKVRTQLKVCPAKVSQTVHGIKYVQLKAAQLLKTCQCTV